LIALSRLIAAELRQELAKESFVSIAIDASNRKSRMPESEHSPLCPFINGAPGAKLPFYKSMTGNLTVYRYRLETYVFQVFAHPETSG